MKVIDNRKYIENDTYKIGDVLLCKNRNSTGFSLYMLSHVTSCNYVVPVILHSPNNNAILTSRTFDSVESAVDALKSIYTTVTKVNAHIVIDDWKAWKWVKITGVNLNVLIVISTLEYF